jgi:hypothetical protein
MSRGLICDQCGTTIVVNDRGEHDAGENAAWLVVRATWMSYDLCSRACAVALIETPEFAERHDAELEVIASIAQIIAEARRGGEEGDDPSPSPVEGGQ